MNPLFLNNKYTKWYYSICNNAKLRNSGEEKHHIIPRSIGGDNSKQNLVLLTTREHMICHLLLTKMCSLLEHSRCMIHAARLMIDRTKCNRTKLLAQIRKQSFKIKSETQKGKPSTFNDLTIVKKTHETRRKNGTNPFITSNPMLNELSKRKKVEKTSGDMHFTKHKKSYFNTKTNEYKYFSSPPSDDWIQQSHLKGKSRSFAGIPKRKDICKFCNKQYPVHIMGRHIKKYHENN